MNWVALRMLFGDRTKYAGLIFGIAFATLLMTQQVSIFIGIMQRTANQILDVRDAGIWVMDPKTRFLDEAPGLPDVALQRVRGVAGVDWAARMYKGRASARMPDGEYRGVVVFGIDEDSLAGMPQTMVLGKLEDLRQPNAVIVDKAGFAYMWPNRPLELGIEFELNDHRVHLVGICQASSPFETMPMVYGRYNTIRDCFPQQRQLMNYVLAEPRKGESPEQVCLRIKAQTNLMALTQSQFFWKTIWYYMGTTGIPVNFGITIALGFIVGAAITGQTFYLFTVENLRQFGALKAMGVTNTRLLGMITLQACVVGALGYGIGIGVTATFFESTKNITHLAGLYMNPWAALGVAGSILVIILITSLLAASKVLFLEPAIVFRGAA